MSSVLVLAPMGRDAALIEQSLNTDDVSCASVGSVEALCQALTEDIDAAIIVEEALPDAGLTKLVAQLVLQPSWSDFPLIILTASGVSHAMSRIFSRLSVNSSVTLIQRPLHPLTLRSAVHVALSARARQYQQRDLLKHLMLQDEVVRRANSALEVSNADLQQFVYAASHDLKEPLRMIVNFAQLTKKRYADKLDATGNEFLDYMLNGATRMNALLDDLLTYSRASDFANVKVQLVDCNDVLSNTLANLTVAIEESCATIAREHLPVVLAHETHLIQLFQNLISNAIRYRSPERALEIKIGVVIEEGFWRFSVTDNGIGIDPEFAQEIFLLFHRLHGKDYSGTGIGLALCERIVRHYGGRIWVQSALDQGATFSFTLPIAKERRQSETKAFSTIPDRLAK